MMHSYVVADGFCNNSLIVFLFPGGPKPSRVVFSAGKLSDFAGKKGKISASRDSTENCLPVLRSLNPRQSRKDKTNNYKAAKYPMYDSKRWNSFSYAGFHIFVVPSFIVNCEEQYCKIENKVKNQHSNSDIVNYHTLILLPTVQPINATSIIAITTILVFGSIIT